MLAVTAILCTVSQPSINNQPALPSGDSRQEYHLHPWSSPQPLHLITPADPALCYFQKETVLPNPAGRASQVLDLVLGVERLPKIRSTLQHHNRYIKACSFHVLTPTPQNSSVSPQPFLLPDLSSEAGLLAQSMNTRTEGTDGCLTGGNTASKTCQLCGKRDSSRHWLLGGMQPQ